MCLQLQIKGHADELRRVSIKECRLKAVLSSMEFKQTENFGAASKQQINLCRVWALFLPTYRETAVTNHQLTGLILLFATDKTIWLCGSTPRAGCREATLPQLTGNLQPQDK